MGALAAGVGSLPAGVALLAATAVALRRSLQRTPPTTPSPMRARPASAAANPRRRSFRLRSSWPMRM